METREHRNRCPATFVQRNGYRVRCEHNIGHDSVHYNGDLWWPNKRGLPKPNQGRLTWLTRIWKRIKP